VLKWEPQISLEEGLERTYEWVEQQVRVSIGAPAPELAANAV
jgi:hypothetical protein